MEPSTRATHAEPTDTNTLFVSASVEREPGLSERARGYLRTIPPQTSDLPDESGAKAE